MAFDGQSVKGMMTAYEAALVDLGLSDRTDPLTELVASKTIAHCQNTGECDPERLCELVLKAIRK